MGGTGVAVGGTGVAVTGIAGPGGGTPTKPVGLVYFAVDLGGEVTVERKVLPGDRAEIKKGAAEHALNMLIERLSNY